MDSSPRRTAPRSPRRPWVLPMGLLALAVVGTSVGCRTFDPVDPDPVISASSLERTESAILDALRREGWRVTEQDAETIEAYQVLDEEYPVALRVEFDAESVEVKWLESKTPSSDSEEEAAALRRVVRRSLGDLQERISYLIESIDLIPEGEPTPSRAKHDGVTP